eukprot:428529_1
MLTALRASQSSAFHTALHKVLQSEPFLSSDIRNTYDIKQINPSYRDQLLDASCYAQSMNGNAPEAVLFHITFNDQYASWKLRVDHFVKTGLYVMIINKKTNQVCGGVGFVDLCDFGPKPEFNKEQYPSNISDRDTCKQYALSMYMHQTEYKPLQLLWNTRYENNVDNCKYFGEYLYCGMHFITPNNRNRGLSSFIIQLADTIDLKCKIRFAIFFSKIPPKTLNKISTLNKIAWQFPIQLSLNNCGICIKKYLNDLTIEYNYSHKQTEKLKNLSMTIGIQSKL